MNILFKSFLLTFCLVFNSLALAMSAEDMREKGDFYAIQGNSDKAIEWYMKATDLGSIDAMHNLGYIYYNRLNNPEEAMKWYTKAAN